MSGVQVPEVHSDRSDTMLVRAVDNELRVAVHHAVVSRDDVEHRRHCTNTHTHTHTGVIYGVARSMHTRFLEWGRGLSLPYRFTAHFYN